MILLKDRFHHKAGTTVYLYEGYDYGLCSDDNFYTQIEHMVVTLDKDGGTPFFTVPITDVEE